MYFCPGWDIAFSEELEKLKNVEDFFLSGTMVQPFESYINLDCGINIESFNEGKLLKELPLIKFNDFQGTHWQPSLISLKTKPVIRNPEITKKISTPRYPPSNIFR